jgi:hypothetical protein
MQATGQFCSVPLTTSSSSVWSTCGKRHGTDNKGHDAMAPSPMCTQNKHMNKNVPTDNMRLKSICNQHRMSNSACQCPQGPRLGWCILLFAPVDTWASKHRASHDNHQASTAMPMPFDTLDGALANLTVCHQGMAMATLKCANTCPHLCSNTWLLGCLTAPRSLYSI